jgi:hypothetical protein
MIARENLFYTAAVAIKIIPSLHMLHQQNDNFRRSCLNNKKGCALFSPRSTLAEMRFFRLCFRLTRSSP